MRHEYDIPEVSVRRTHAALWATGVLVVLAIFMARHIWYLWDWIHYRLISAIWLLSFLIVAAQWVVSWLEKQRASTPVQDRRLNRMRVTVNVPVYNEEPIVLDRVLYALFTQSRLPDRVDVVDDGSAISYEQVRSYWQSRHPASVEFRWKRQDNRGKKQAQAQTFADPDTDIFVTLDSDTTLERHAIREGIRPFADRKVQSVAGLELAWNHDCNLLTRLKSVNSLIWQLVTCSSQNVLNNVLVNRGTFALYRGDLVRDNLAAYLGEKLFGRTVVLGDDTMLTLLALGRGKAVQQPSAVCFAMYPETLSHTMRQWTRWMRGTSIRTLWRLRHLSPFSWGWWYTVLTTWGYLSFMAVLAAILVDWPSSEEFAMAALYITCLWTWIIATRIFVLRRSDQQWVHRAEAFVLVPLGLVWMTLVLRPMRLYGQITMLRQGWVTRLDGAETRTISEGETRLPERTRGHADMERVS